MIIRGTLRVRGRDGMLNLEPAEAMTYLAERQITVTAETNGIVIPEEQGWTFETVPTDSGDGECTTYSYEGTPIIQQWTYEGEIPEQFYQLISD